MKIGILVPDAEMGRMAVDIGRSLGVEVFWSMIDGNGRREVENARELLQLYDVEAFVCRNPSGYQLERAFSIPVSIMHISRIDMLRAMDRISSDKTIAFVFVPEDKNKYNYDLEEISRFSGRKIKIFAAKKSRFSKSEVDDDTFESELGISLEEFLTCHVIISGTPSLIQFAAQHGMETSVIEFDSFDLQCALENAIRMAETRRREVRNAELIETALNTTNDGFLTVEFDRVTMVSDNICHMSGMEKKNILGKQERILKLSNPFFRLVFGVGKKEIINYNNKPYSVFRRVVPAPHGNSELELISVIDIPEIQKTEAKIRKALVSSGFSAKWKFQDIIMRSKKMSSLIHTAKQYALSDQSILILGESGTGKEVFAQSIHNASPFAKGPFVALNCAALPENLIESELFGYEEGAFTGAKKGGKAGLFELSHGGTLFLDEIGELPMMMQAKLLRSIQERAIYRIGADRVIPITNRLICATNQDLYELVKKKQFRQDLLYRINVLQLDIPPLRERKEDIALFIQNFYYKNLHHSSISDDTVTNLTKMLLPYDWPGNVRELENFLAHLLVLRRGGTSMEQLENYIRESIAKKMTREGSDSRGEGTLNGSTITLHLGTMQDMEDQIISIMRERCNNNHQEIAKKLNLGYSTIQRRFQRINKKDNG